MITDPGRKKVGLLLAPLPYLLMAGVAATDLVGGVKTGALPLLAMCPAVAAVYGGVAYTALAGGTAGALCGSIDAYQHLFASTAQMVVFAAVLGVAAAALVISAGRERRARELADVQTVANVAQQAVLRPVAARPEIPVQVAVRYMSAASKARIGGDLYEVLTSRDAVRMIIGDVKGKGLPAVQTAATVLGVFRDIAPDATELSAIAGRIERTLAHHLAEEEFVTAVIAEVSPDGSAMTVLNCGHPPPLHLRGSLAAFIEPADASLPLGLGGLGGHPWQVTRIALRPADGMLFYTDGISEARNRGGDVFPLGHAVPRCARPDADEMLDMLSVELARHVGHTLDDDAAMLLVRRQAALTGARAGASLAAPRLPPGAVAAPGALLPLAAVADAPAA